VERALAEHGGVAALTTPKQAAAFLASVEKGAGLLTGAASVKALGVQLRVKLEQVPGLELSGPSKG
jgi:hypothetical protein